MHLFLFYFIKSLPINRKIDVLSENYQNRQLFMLKNVSLSKTLHYQVSLRVICLLRLVKMKFFILLLVFIISFSATCFGQNELGRDFDEFLALIPQEEANEISLKYLQIDEFVAVVLYALYDEGFKQIILDIESIPEFVEVIFLLVFSHYYFLKLY